MAYGFLGKCSPKLFLYKGTRWNVSHHIKDVGHNGRMEMHTHTHVHSKQWKATGWPCDTGIMPFGPILPPPTVSLDYKKWAAFTSQGLWPGHAQTMETTNYLHLSAKGTVQIFKNLKSSAIWQKPFLILCPPHLFSYLELEKEGREMKRKGGTQKSLALGSAPRREGVEGCWWRPRWIRNPRVERTGPHLSHLEPWASSTLSLVPQSPGNNHTGRAARMVGNWEGPHSPHNPSRDPERQEKENHAFKETPKWVVNSEPSSLWFQCFLWHHEPGRHCGKSSPIPAERRFCP